MECRQDLFLTQIYCHFKGRQRSEYKKKPAVTTIKLMAGGDLERARKGQDLWKNQLDSGDGKNEPVSSEDKRRQKLARGKMTRY
jgi:hypothetical protein